MKTVVYIALEFNERTFKEDLRRVREEILRDFAMFGSNANACGTMYKANQITSYDFQMTEQYSNSISLANFQEKS